MKRAEEYPWSSAPAHCGLVVDYLLSGEFNTAQICDDWSVWINANASTAFEDTIREFSKKGRPCGNDNFLDDIEEKTGLALRHRKSKKLANTVIAEK